MREKQPKNDKTHKESDIHHSGDKSFKVIMRVKESAIEYIERFFPMLFKYLDLTQLELDNTNYVAPDFDEYYSDVVYRTVIKNRKSKTKKPVALVLLFEHKKTIKSYFALFLQLLEYIVLIWKDDLANKRKPSVIIPIVFFQGKKGLNAKEMHDCFKGIPQELLEYIPNFSCHITNVHSLKNEAIVSLNQQGLLRSLLLAYTYKERKYDIENMLIEIFKFFEHDMDRFDFFKLMFEFIAKEDYLSADEINEIMTRYNTSPKVQETIMTTYQVWKNEGKNEGRLEGKIEGILEGKIKQARLTVLKGRWKGASADFLADISDLPKSDVDKLLKAYDHVFELWKNKQPIKDIDYLLPTEIDDLLNLFSQNQN